MIVYNRDLSWLGFNERVLQEAACAEVPLLERFRFLAIFSSNLDEFFRVRYPELAALSALGKKSKRKWLREDEERVLEKVQEEIRKQQTCFGEILQKQLIPSLQEQGITLCYDQPFMAEHAAEVRQLFLSEILAYLQPVLLSERDKKVFIPENNQLYLVCLLQQTGQDVLQYAILKIPTDPLPRLWRLSAINDHQYIVFLDDIIRAHVHYVFPGFDCLGCYAIKLNRNADLHLEERFEKNILSAIERQLKKRDFGAPSRLLYEDTMPDNVLLFLSSYLGISYEEMFCGGRYHNLKDLMELPVHNPNLSFPARPSLLPARLSTCTDLFRAIEEGSFFLHFPYESYSPVLIFFSQAAVDPFVTEVKVTLYRVASESIIVRALMNAARNGKKVTVFLELKARFDEANNIRWGREMEQAGVQIIYSIPEIKVHSKIALVHRRCDGSPQSYAILSTGNFNEKTASIYSDHTLFTADGPICRELGTLFLFLEKGKQPKGKHASGFDKLLVSQINMIARFEALIAREIKKASEGGIGRIRIKLNNLEEPYMISLLYQASLAGVKIQLLVRSVCCLIPGVPGQSENIEVRRIVDRYLEHSRFFIFGSDDEATVIMGSSDWMTRNLRRRIEVCTILEEPEHKTVLMDYFSIQWRDTDKAVRLMPDMTQQRLPQSEGRHNAQQEIFDYLKRKR